MDFKTGIFYLFSAILVFASLKVILARNPVHSALFLVLSFVTSSVLWMMLEAEFLAISLVLVYVGAVMVLFLFVVMMIDIDLSKLRQGFWKYLPAGGLVGVLMVVEMTLVLGSKHFGLDVVAAPEAKPAVGYSNVRELGRLIYTEYVYAFELAAVLLLVAIVAAIALTLRRRKETKYQNPAEQVAVRRADRVRIVKMASEPKVGAQQAEATTPNQ